MPDREETEMNDIDAPEPLETVPAPPQPPPTRPSSRSQPVKPAFDGPAAGMRSKNPYLAAILSGFPGAGNIYNGLYMRAIVFFLIIASLIGLANRGTELFGFGVAFFWIFNVLDAYRQATLINLGLVSDLGIADRPETPYRSQGGLAAGGILFAIGLFALLDKYFYIDIDWILNLWPVAFMGLGGWLVWASMRDKKKAEAEAAAEGSVEESSLY